MSRWYQPSENGLWIHLVDWEAMLEHICTERNFILIKSMMAAVTDLTDGNKHSLEKTGAFLNGLY